MLIITIITINVMIVITIITILIIIIINGNDIHCNKNNSGLPLLLHGLQVGGFCSGNSRMVIIVMNIVIVQLHWNYRISPYNSGLPLLLHGLQLLQLGLQPRVLRAGLSIV